MVESTLLFSRPSRPPRCILTSSKYIDMLYRVTVLVENVEDGREYTVEEIHNSDSEISQISVQDPLRYLYLYTKTRTKTKTKTKTLF